MNTPNDSCCSRPRLLTLTALGFSAVVACTPSPSPSEAPSQLQEPTEAQQPDANESPSASTNEAAQHVVQPTTNTLPPTDDSTAPRKRIPPTFNSLNPLFETWASPNDYHRWFSELVAQGVPPLVGFSSPVKSLNPRLFQIKPGETVADIGCGTGALEFALLSSETPFEKLYAVDIDATSLDFLNTALNTAGADPDGRIETVLSSMDDVSLPQDSIDAMLVLYTRLMPPGVADRSAMKHPTVNALFDSIKKALKPGGRLHIVDSLHESTGAGEDSHRTAARPTRSLRNYDPEHVIQWMTGLGFALTSQAEISTSPAGERNYHLTFSYSD
ncbi:MAG: class I SAM-dependent methyltransferase [Myxococcota bacterium]|nr:class I SAM-dependent methyltransferase [Myxococcota bacterium]